jgi:hypothetical protein
VTEQCCALLQGLQDDLHRAQQVKAQQAAAAAQQLQGQVQGAQQELAACRAQLEQQAVAAQQEQRAWQQERQQMQQEAQAGCACLAACRDTLCGCWHSPYQAASSPGLGSRQGVLLACCASLTCRGVLGASLTASGAQLAMGALGHAGACWVLSDSLTVQLALWQHIITSLHHCAVPEGNQRPWAPPVGPCPSPANTH